MINNIKNLKSWAYD